jgi:hypothetical protein
VDFDGKQALEDITNYGWSAQLTNKHAKKMLSAIQNLGRYLKQLA